MIIHDELKKRLNTAQRIVFFTGAGISAESGISTFRGKDGIWNKLKPEELANFNAFMKNPDLVWEWYQYRRQIVSEAGPNNAHKTIARLQDYYDVKVVTQNVDNLHRRAGSKDVYELHGNIERNYCIDCKSYYYDVNIEEKTKVPKCDKCGGLIRPDIVWFGEMLPAGVFEEGEKMAAKSDICFVIGTSAVVYPAAYIPQAAKQYGSYVVEINIEETEFTYQADLSIFGKAGEVLPEIFKDIIVDEKPEEVK